MPDLDPFFFTINTWSFTKHRVWNRCQRRYYFEYIAPYVKSDRVVNPEKIRWLKNFTSKFVVQGQLIHDIIDQQIQLHCEKKPMDLDEAMKAFSKKVSLYKNIGGETITEYHNGERIPNSFFTYIEVNGNTCLQTFFGKWPSYLTQEVLRHEEYDHFSIGDVGVTVKEDLVGRKPDGTPDGIVCALGKGVLQNESRHTISTELVYLKTGTTKPIAFYEEQLHEVQEMIPREYAAMNASYELGISRPDLRSGSV